MMPPVERENCIGLLLGALVGVAALLVNAQADSTESLLVGIIVVGPLRAFVGAVAGGGVGILAGAIMGFLAEQQQE